MRTVGLVILCTLLAAAPAVEATPFGCATRVESRTEPTGHHDCCCGTESCGCPGCTHHAPGVQTRGSNAKADCACFAARTQWMPAPDFVVAQTLPPVLANEAIEPGSRPFEEPVHAVLRDAGPPCSRPLLI